MDLIIILVQNKLMWQKGFMRQDAYKSLIDQFPHLFDLFYIEEEENNSLCTERRVCPCVSDLLWQKGSRLEWI